MKRIVCALILLWTVPRSFGQHPTALYVGDFMPEYRFERMLQYPFSNLDLESLHGKVVILDFWDSSCASCIDLMPHMQQLQDQFGKDLQIILVNGSKGDDEQKIRKIMTNIQKGRGTTVSLPIALYDSTLLTYFPHRGRPFEVVLSRAGKVLATTSAEDISKKNIQLVIEGKEGLFSTRNDFWDINLPAIFRIDRRHLEDVVFNSSFTKANWIPPTGPKYNQKGQMVGTSVLFSLLSAYSMAYRRELFYGAPVIEYRTTDSVFKYLPGKQVPMAFVYDLSCPAGRFNQDLFDTCLKQDLDRSFKFSLQRVFKDTSCLVIKTNKRLEKIYSKTAAEDQNIDHLVTASKNGVPVYANSISVSGLVGWLNLVLSGSPAGTGPTAKIVNESTDTHLIDIKFPAGFDLGNFEKVRTYLSARGIDLSVERRRQAVVVISDKKPGDPTILN